MRVGGACQHAKLMVLVVRDRKSKQLSIVLGAGSFNLTKAGWWENLEVGHWVELSEGFAPSNILEPLLDALRFYQARTPSPVVDNILGVAMAFEASTADPNCSFTSRAMEQRIVISTPLLPSMPMQQRHWRSSARFSRTMVTTASSSIF